MPHKHPRFDYHVCKHCVCNASVEWSGLFLSSLNPNFSPKTLILSRSPSLLPSPIYYFLSSSSSLSIPSKRASRGVFVRRCIKRYVWVCMHVCVCVRACVRACVRVCVTQSETEKDRDTETQIETLSQRHRDRQTEETGWFSWWRIRPKSQDRAIPSRARFPGVTIKGFHLSAQSPFRCAYNPCVQSHASTSVRTLKIQNPWQTSYHCLDTGKYCTHW